jgi:hypothetical protein
MAVVFTSDTLQKLSVVPLPELPSIKYNHKKVTDSDIDQLIGTYSLRYVHVIEIITIHLYYKYKVFNECRLLPDDPVLELLVSSCTICC